ncbi:MAG: DEAD/DEAH box helicase [Caulobacteraceae bacterium]|nr:DEAD/DEAH box helicase [Caulobacteraceae bacterium]
MTQFTDLGLAKPILKALAREGYETPTPIQAQAIPGVLKGRDLLGIAQTGTGKTAAFALPILHRLAEDRKPAPRRGARCLVLSPTRELASQIADSFRTYGAFLGMSVAVVFGGAKYGPQVKALAGGVDILVATPGRLIDHLGERTADLSSTEILVLDEADQMLDLGFLQPIRRIVSGMSRKRQNLFFSATMPTEIGKLAAELLNDPVSVQVTPAATTVERIDQQVLFVEAPRKRALLSELFEDARITRALVFTRTKRGADRVAKYLDAAQVSAAAIHGDKSQGQRERALAAFKAGKVRALIATDIAARGIDVDGVSHVIQYELPQVPEAYVHRIGRTARAGAVGVAISFCADDERGLLRDIQKTTRQTIPSFDRRNDRQLAVLTAAAPPIPAAEQALPQAKGRGPRPQDGKPDGGKPQGPKSQGPKSQGPKPQGRRRRGRPGGGGPQGAGKSGEGQNRSRKPAAQWDPLKA